MDDCGGQRQEWREAMTQFEVFRRQPPAGAHEPTVTVQRHGLLTLNQAAYAELGAPDAVQLLYAHRERLIGLRAAGPRLRMPIGCASRVLDQDSSSRVGPTRTI